MAALGRGGRVVETRNRPARARHSEEDKAGIEAGEILRAKQGRSLKCPTMARSSPLGRQNRAVANVIPARQITMP